MHLLYVWIYTRVNAIRKADGECCVRHAKPAYSYRHRWQTKWISFMCPCIHGMSVFLPRMFECIGCFYEGEGNIEKKRSFDASAIFRHVPALSHVVSVRVYGFGAVGCSWADGATTDTHTTDRVFNFNHIITIPLSQYTFYLYPSLLPDAVEWGYLGKVLNVASNECIDVCCTWK